MTTPPPPTDEQGALRELVREAAERLADKFEAALSTPNPAAAGEEREALAEAVHRGRYHADTEPEPFADEHRFGREYCFRIADIILAAGWSRRPAEADAGEMDRLRAELVDAHELCIAYASDSVSRADYEKLLVTHKAEVEANNLLHEDVAALLQELSKVRAELSNVKSAHQVYRDCVTAEVATLRAQADRAKGLAEALEPFARIYDLNVPLRAPDHDGEDYAHLYVPDTAVKWGELRAAATALAEYVSHAEGRGDG